MMSAESFELSARALASVILLAIDDANPPRGLALHALTHCCNHLENRTSVESAILVSGYSTTGFHWNEDLELYYDIAKNGEDVAFLSKGWDDPGFRLGEIVAVDGWDVDRLEEVKDSCNTNGIVMSYRECEESSYEVTLEQVIYVTGFDGRTLSQALSNLIECSNRFKRS